MKDAVVDFQAGSGCGNSSPVSFPDSPSGLPEPALLTIPEAAVFLRVKECTVREWIRTNRIHALRFGRMWRIERAGLLVDGRRAWRKMK